MIKTFKIVCLLLLFNAHNLLAQEAFFPIVKGFGGIYEIPEATELPDPSSEIKIIIDLVSAAEDPTEINFMVNNIARMINLHGLGGIPHENIHVKVAVHGGAIFSLLEHESYKALYGVDNPNLAVYDALKAAGVEIYVCGQSLIARNIEIQDIWDGSEIALSMFTTLTKYIPEGYILLRF